MKKRRMKIYNPYDICPCNSSGKKAKFCCLERGKVWNKKPTILKSTKPTTGFQHQKCYAKQTSNCSNKISSEHFISNNMLEGLEHNKAVKVSGFPWQEKGSFNLLSRQSLVSNILCKNHNELLSSFDSEMGRLYRTILKYDDDFNSDAPINDIAVFCGEDLEKWMLKTVCAFIASNQVHNNGEKKNVPLKEIYIDILFNDKPWPEKWGMYFYIPKSKNIQKHNSISLLPLTGNNEVQAWGFLINNFKFYLLLGEPEDQNIWGVYRPRGIELSQGKVTKTIEICWQDPKYNNYICMTRRGTTNSVAGDWSEWVEK